MKRLLDIATAVGIVFCSLFLLAQVPSFRDFLPANTIVGRLGVGPGPSQAIPFATLVANLPLPQIGGGSATSGTAYFVSTTGSDSNDCLAVGTPCLTIQHAIDLCNLGAICSISLADGTYTTTVGFNITYPRFVSITGNCGNVSAVTVALGANSIAAFTVQDLAIGTISCITFTTNATSNTIAFGRQIAIIDLTNIAVGSAFVNGRVAASTTFSSVNVTGGVNITATPAMIDFVNSGIHGMVTLAGTVTIQNSGGTISNFFNASTKSVIEASGTTFAGAGAGTNTTGARCTITDSTLLKPVGTIPGTTACASAPAADAATGAGYIP